ncbi:hypothetical protein GWK48_09375 [Metallosphaera tengchongensis]|uniref:Uncharacterized protein n=1 Tax=Metallosphaera tengchongensis TaxID=1532350 RepID=A0A6N0NZR4_9CREN|nr:hypothetical protein [Metallosphaera tengchongensis]QKR00560.1 hypothetical protein GWK48_09375 [Metallosphaera tengchongensis]
MEPDLNKLEIMNLGVMACQRKRTTLGNYEVYFRVLRRDNESFYVIEIKFMGRKIQVGIFTDFSKATLFAGEWIKSLL